jgi:hypothetical protein
LSTPVFVSGGGIGSVSAAVSIRSGSYDVLTAGTVITYERELVFSIHQLRVVMEFVTDEGATRVDSLAEGSTTLRLRLFNFSSTLGSSTTAPMPIGTYGGRKLYLSFVVLALSGGSGKTVHYTLTLGESA